MKRVLAFALLTASLTAFGQSYPSRPVRLVVPLSPGGFADTPTRILAPRLSEQFGKQFFVENRPGAGGTIGWDFVAKQPADGYSVLVGATGQMSIAAAVYPDLPYHPSKTFTPLNMIASFPLVLVVSANNQSKSVKDMVEWAKAHPDKQFSVMQGMSHASFQQKNYMMVYHILHAFFSQPDPVYRG